MSARLSSSRRLSTPTMLESLFAYRTKDFCITAKFLCCMFSRIHGPKDLSAILISLLIYLVHLLTDKCNVKVEKNDSRHESGKK